MESLRRFLFSGGSWAVALLLLAGGWMAANFTGNRLPFFGMVAIPLFTWVLLFQRAVLLPALVFMIPLSLMVSAGGGAVVNFPSEIILVLLCIIYGGRSVITPTLNRKVLLHPIVLLVVIETAWMFFTAMISDYPVAGLKRVVIRSGYIFVFVILLAHWFEQPGRTAWLWILYAVGCVVPIITAVVTHAAYNFSPHTAYFVTKPFFVEHTLYGACLAFLIPALFIFLMNYRLFGLTGWKPWLLLSVFALVALAEVLAFSRAAWISLIGAGFFALLIQLRIRVWILVLGLAAGVSIVWINRDAIIETISRNEAVSTKGSFSDHLQSVANVQTDASNLERINRWSCAVEMASEKPITGFGPGSYQFVYGQFQVRRYMTRISTFSGNKGHAHSELFTSLSETGFPGMFIYLAVMFTTIGFGLNIIYHAADLLSRKIALAAVLSLSTFYIHGFFNAFLDTDKMAVLVFGAMAVIISTWVRMKQTEKYRAQ
ncbi:MAG TPA: O-antigen ligase family protein [Bacteroidia bacterium]|nr:O-antigen ligase family protein [Bacteroidia bacterium]